MRWRLRRVTNRNLVICGGCHGSDAIGASAAKYLLPPRKAKAEATRYPDYYGCWSEAAPPVAPPDASPSPLTEPAVVDAA